MDIFTDFSNSTYTFLELHQGGVKGNTVIESTPSQGILKIREGMSSAGNRDMQTTTTTMHIKPSEPFVDDLGGNLVGHGVRVIRNGGTAATYRIVGQVEGFDFDTGILEFYRLSLKRESIAV